MSLIRFNPSRDLWKVRTDLDRLFNQFFNRAYESEDYPEVDWSPRLEIAENDDNFIINVELPGMKKQDVSIALQNDVLTLQGDKKVEKSDKGHNYNLCERHYGKFIRSFRLPAQVNGEKIDASFKDGVLSLTLPKIEESKPKQIEIKSK